jgi:transcriptional repressor NrdR
MKCPKCKCNDTRVIDSRETNEGRETRRRRTCEECEHRFTTFERVDVTNFLVIKKDGSREAYDRGKLIHGIWRSCEKRPITQEQIDQIVDVLEEKWAGLGREVGSKVLGEDVMDMLKKLDEVAYIRFASVYRHFKDLDSFKKELSKLLE